MRPFVVTIHPLALAAGLAILVPAVAVAAGTNLKPPVEIAGSEAFGLLEITSSFGTGVVVSAENYGIYSSTRTAKPDEYAIQGAAKVSGIGVKGTSQTGYAGYFESYDGSYALKGVTDGAAAQGAVYGFSKESGPGVRGDSRQEGVLGISGSPDFHQAGVVGTSITGANGVEGRANGRTASGVFGANQTNGIGVYGDSSNRSAGFAAFFHSENNNQNYATIVVQNGGNSGARAASFTGDVDISGNTTLNGNLTVNGSITTGSCTGCAARARLVNGFAVVRFASNAREAAQPYTVTVTALADSRGLYVSQKLPGAFVVRENQGGRSTLDFDYQVVFGGGVAKPVKPVDMARYLHD